MSKNKDLENGQTYVAKGNYTNKGTLGINDQWYGYDAGSAMSVAGNLTNSGTVAIDTSNSGISGAAGGSTLTVSGALINHGLLTIGNENLDNLGDGRTGNAQTTVTASAFVNTGTLALIGGAAVRASLIVGSAAPGTLTASDTLYGDALLQFGSGFITSIGKGGSLVLEAATGPDMSAYGGNQGGGTAPVAVPQIVNAQAGGSALGQLTSNAGTLVLDYEVSIGTGAGVDLTNSGFLGLDSDQFGPVAGATMSVGGNLINSGTICVDTTDSGSYINNYGAAGGGSLTVAHTLNNSGVLQIGNENLGYGTAGQPGTTVTAAAFVNTGSLVLTGGAAVRASLIVGSAAPGTLTASDTLYGDALLQFGSGFITSIGKGGSLVLEAATGPDMSPYGGNQGGGTAPLAVPQIVNAQTGGSALSQLTNNAGTLVLDYEVSIGTGAGVDLTNSGFIGLDSDQFGPVAGATMSVGGDLINSGTICLDTTDSDTGIGNYGAAGGGSLTVSHTLNNSGVLQIGNENLGYGTAGQPGTTVTAAAFVNTGSLTLIGGAAVRASLIVGTAAPGTLTASDTLYGDALLQFGSGFITSIGKGGSLILMAATGPNMSAYGGNQGGGAAPLAVPQIVNAQAGGSALSQLTSNAGTLVLDYEVSIGTAAGVDFTNSGFIGLDSDQFGPVAGATMSVGGNLINTGTICLDTTDSDTGIGNFGAAGGGSLTVAQTLTNSGVLQIGNQDLGAGTQGTPGTTVTAVGFVNTGSLSLTGGAAVRASLIVGSAAPGALTASIYLYGDALLQFGSGFITSIGKGGSLTLEAATGPDLSGYGGNQGGGTAPLAVPQIVNAQAGVSALNQLTSNAGTLVLNYEVSIGTGAGVDFTNSGFIGLDYNEFGSVVGATMSVGGNLINTGTISLDTSDSNNFGAAGGGSLTVAQTLTNSGDLQIGNEDLGGGTKGKPGTTVTVAGLSNSSSGQIMIQGGVGGATGAATVTATQASINNGSIAVAGAANVSFAALMNAGSISSAGGDIVVGGMLTGNGSLTIDNGTLTVDSSAASPVRIEFAGKKSKAVLNIGDLKDFAANISGFSDGETIDLRGIKATSETYSNGVLTLFNGAKSIGNLNISGAFTTNSFALNSDGNGGTDIRLVNTDTVPATAPFVQAMAGLSAETGALSSLPHTYAWRPAAVFQLATFHRVLA